ncbi:hypothetical protein ABZ372_37365, partial [Streptomyces sp. NPDC005921]
MGILTLSTLNTVVERALARHGVTTTVITPFPLLDRRREADPDTEFLGIHKWADLRELQDIAHSVKNVDAVMTVDEQCVAAAGFLRDTLGIGGQSYRDALRTTNKHLMKAVVAAGPNPVPVAEHEVAHTVDDVRAAGARLGYPLILKPLSGFGAVSTFRVDSEEHLLEPGLSRLHRTGEGRRRVCQQRQPGREFTEARAPRHRDVGACLGGPARVHGRHHQVVHRPDRARVERGEGS